MYQKSDLDLEIQFTEATIYLLYQNDYWVLFECFIKKVYINFTLKWCLFVIGVIQHFIPPKLSSIFPGNVMPLSLHRSEALFNKILKQMPSFVFLCNQLFEICTEYMTLRTLKIYPLILIIGPFEGKPGNISSNLLSNPFYN